MRVGGSSWGPKIDPKKLQDMKKNDFDEDGTRGDEKKDNKNNKKRQYDLAKGYDTHLPENNRRKTGKKVPEFGWPSPPESHPSLRG